LACTKESKPLNCVLFRRTSRFSPPAAFEEAFGRACRQIQHKLETREEEGLGREGGRREGT